MSGKKETEGDGKRDLRTRYIPGMRMRQGFLSFAPWFDIMLILFYLVLLQSRIVLRPGVVVDLPVGGVNTSGLQQSLIAVFTATGSLRDPVYKVFFNDEQFIVGDEGRMDALKAALVAHRRTQGDAGLTLYADRRIDYQHLTMLIRMAQEAGIQQVNLGTQPADGP